MVILASGSARRRELLRERFDDLIIDPPHTEETVDIHGDPKIEAMHCAMLKGEEVASRHSSGILIACDTMVYLNQLIGKPTSRSDAFQIITALAGRTHQVYTGIYLKNLDQGTSLIDYEVSNVTFRRLSKEDIEHYLNQADYLDKAGAYGIQEEGRELVYEIIGDVTNVIGLPMGKLEWMLAKINPQT